MRRAVARHYRSLWGRPARKLTFGGPLWPGSECRAYLIIPEVEDYLPPLVSRRAHVQFLRAMPIFDSEIDLKKEHGAGWVMEELHDQGMRIGDAKRRPLAG